MSFVIWVSPAVLGLLLAGMGYASAALAGLLAGGGRASARDPKLIGAALTVCAFVVWSAASLAGAGEGLTSAIMGQ